MESEGNRAEEFSTNDEVGSNCVPIREVSSFQRVVCTGFNGVETWRCVPIREVSYISEGGMYRLQSKVYSPFSLYRLERLLCQLDAQSPILSDAEVSMEHELSQLQTKLKAMYYHLEEVTNT